jgi:hypothetical protein
VQLPVSFDRLKVTHEIAMEWAAFLSSQNLTVYEKDFIIFRVPFFYNYDSLQSAGKLRRFDWHMGPEWRKAPGNDAVYR